MISSYLNIFALRFLNFVIGLLPDFAITGIPALSVTSTVLNIFAWIKFLLPVNLIMALLTITASYYAFKLIFNMIKNTKDILF